MPVLRNNEGRSKIIRGLLIGQFAHAVLSAIIFLSAINGARQLTSGNPNTEFLDKVLIAMNVLSVFGTVLNVFTIVFFILWFRRAYYNIHQIPEAEPTYHHGWAACAWFVPLINLFRPKQIMTEIWRSTQRYAQDDVSKRKNTQIHIWWYLFVFGHFMNFSLFRMQFNATTKEDWLAILRLGFIAVCVFTAAALIIFNIIWKLSKFEKLLYEKHHKMDITDHLVG